MSSEDSPQNLLGFASALYAWLDVTWSILGLRKDGHAMQEIAAVLQILPLSPLPEVVKIAKAMQLTGPYHDRVCRKLTEERFVRRLRNDARLRGLIQEWLDRSRALRAFLRGAEA